MPSTISVLDSTGSTVVVNTIDSLNTLTGEVTASPTANTVLDRLKAIKTSVDAATPAGTNVIGKVSIDQTTPGTTNFVAANLTQVNGTAMLTGGVNGSVGTGGLAASGAAVSGNPVLIGGSDGTNARSILTDALGSVVSTSKSIVVTAALSATGTLIAATDSGDMSHVLIQFTGTYSGVTVVFEQSNDNANWVSAFLGRVDSFPSLIVTSVSNPTANSIYSGALQGRYFRCRVTAYSSGTITGTANFGSAPYIVQHQPVAIYGLSASSTQVQPTMRALNSDSLGINSDNTMEVTAAQILFNSTGWDRMRSNHEQTVFSSAARTTTQTSSDLINYNGRGLKVIADVTSAGTGSITVSINGKSTLSGKYYPLLTGVAITTNSTNVYTIFPGAPATANVSANDVPPRIFQVVVTANNANSMTYSVDVQVTL